MRINILLISVLATAAVAACNTDSREASSASARAEAADNTARNDRDRTLTPTADNAVTTSSDLELTQRIRQAVVDDDSLSTNAQNCKIVVNRGVVTLVGPVANQAERAKVEQIATSIVGADKLVSQLEITN